MMLIMPELVFLMRQKRMKFTAKVTKFYLKVLL